MPERDRVAQQVAIVGLGRFGVAVAGHLYARGHEVFGIDRDDEMVQRAKDVLTHGVQVELYDAALVRDLGLHEYDAAVVAIGADMEASIVTTAVLVEAGVRHVVARATSPRHGMILGRVGAHEVVYPEAATGEAVAHRLRAPGVSAYIGLGEDIGLGVLHAPDIWAGRSLGDLRLPERGHCVVLAIQRGAETLTGLGADATIAAGDTLAILTQESQLDELPLGPRPGQDHTPPRQ